MNEYITPEILGQVGLAVWACLSFAAVVVCVAVGLKKLFGKHERMWAITRYEYDKDQATRKEQMDRLELKCEAVEAASQKRHDDHLLEVKSLIETLVALKVEVASLTGHLRSSCPGGSACRTQSSPSLPSHSSLLPRAGS